MSFENRTAGDDSGRIPDDWSTHKGPANWFTFRCPADCRVRQQDTILEIDRPGAESRASLVICVTWVGEEPAVGALLPDLRVLFPDLVWLERTRFAATTCRTAAGEAAGSGEPPLCAEAADSQAAGAGKSVPLEYSHWFGASRRPAQGSFWRRWFGTRPIYQWQFWTCRRLPLLITATVQSAPGARLDPQWGRDCERIVSSLRIAVRPAWPPDVFRNHVLELAARYFPLLQVEPAGSFSIRLADSEIHLANSYRLYLLKPEEFRRIVLPALTAVVRLQELSPEQIVPPLRDVRQRILPMLSPEDDGASDELVRMPWVGGLNVSYVLDEHDAYRFIHVSMLEEWGLELDELHALALQNLQRYAAEHPLEVTVVGDQEDPTMLMPVRPDAYNCVRLLDPAFHSRLRELFGPELLVGLPNRDFFVAVSLNHPSVIPEVQARVGQDYASMHYPLTRRLLVISADGVSEYC